MRVADDARLAFSFSLRADSGKSRGTPPSMKRVPGAAADESIDARTFQVMPFRRAETTKRQQ
jgi:hypothetical protein